MGSEPDWVTELMEERRKREDRAAKRAMRRRQSNEQLWIALAGDHLPEMLTSQQETEKYLQHDSWKLRLAAISILRTLWGASPEMAKTCGKMAFDDPNVQVRAAALFILACCYSAAHLPKGSVFRVIPITWDSRTPDPNARNLSVPGGCRLGVCGEL